MNWELIVHSHLIAAGILELICLFCIINPNRLFQEKTARKLALLFFYLGWIVCLVIFGINYTLAQAPPFGSMFHVMCFMPLTLAPLYLYVAHVQKRSWLLGYFAATALISLIGALCMDFNAHWSQMPALQSPWFVPHVSSYMLSYVLATVGTLLAIVSYFSKQKKQEYTEAAAGIILLSFPFMTFGLWSGALWAEEAWGAYWAWDPKEVWSLITWSGYIIYFHLRKTAAWKQYQRQVLFASYIALVITFLVVNLMSNVSSMHNYAS